jgi:hypothetical protein
MKNGFRRAAKEVKREKRKMVLHLGSALIGGGMAARNYFILGE